MSYNLVDLNLGSHVVLLADATFLNRKQYVLWSLLEYNWTGNNVRKHNLLPRTIGNSMFMDSRLHFGKHWHTWVQKTYSRFQSINVKSSVLDLVWLVMNNIRELGWGT